MMTGRELNYSQQFVIIVIAIEMVFQIWVWNDD